MKAQPRLTKPGFCDSCPINKYTKGYVPPQEIPDSNLLIVGEAAGETEIKLSRPFSGMAGSYLNRMLTIAGIPRQKWNVVNCIGCQPAKNIFPGSDAWTYTSKETAREAIAHCAEHHLKPFLFKKKWSKILALGNAALKATTGKIGISTWRGSPLAFLNSDDKPTVMPTYHPSYVGRMSQFFPVVVTDIAKSLIQPKLHVELNPELDPNWKPKRFAFDLEWNQKGDITVCGITDKRNHAKVWTWGPDVQDYLKRVFEEAEDLIGWNIISADLPFFEKLGWDVSKARLHDTMLKQHLTQPDYPHSLAFSASIWTNFPFWKGRTKELEDAEAQDISGAPQWKTWNKSWGIPLKYGGYKGCQSEEEAFLWYNAYDNIHSYEAEIGIQSELEKNDLEGIYENVSVPIALISREITKDGWKLNSSKFDEMAQELDEDIAKLDKALPPGLRSYQEEVGINLPAPPNTYKEKTKKCRSCKKILTFSKPEDTVTCCGKEVSSGAMKLKKVIRSTRLKTIRPWASSKAIGKYVEKKNLERKYSAKTGNETTDKYARAQWALKNPEFGILNELTQVSTLRSSFAKDSLRKEPRMFYDVRVHGTASGRVSVVGKRKGIDLNIQNQPEVFRKVYIPDYDYQGTLNSDFKSGDNTLTAWFAGDLERLDRIKNDPDYDDHLETAIAFFGSEGKNLRKPGKIVNHGMNYGMGPKKLLMEFQKNGLFQYSLVDIKEFIAIWKNKNDKIAKWQSATIAAAERDGYLRNPFGRLRVFNMRDYAAKALAFLPSSTLADVLHRCMIGLYPDRFGNEINALGIKSGSLPKDWHIKTQVHDSLVTIGHDDYVEETKEVLTYVMTQEWKELDGLSLGLSHEYSGKGGSWGDCK